MKLEEVKQKITPVLRQHGVKRAAVFGSVSRGEDTSDSDVDLLVKLGPGPMGMFAYMAFVRELEKAVGRKVDVIPEGNVDKYLRPYILSDLKKIYEE